MTERKQWHWTRKRTPGDTPRWLRGIALLLSLASITLLLLNLGAHIPRNEGDDRSVYFAGSASSLACPGRVRTLVDRSNEALAACGADQRCRWRSAFRINTLLNYPLASLLINQADSNLLSAGEPLCRRVSVSVMQGLASLQIAVWLAFLLLVATDRGGFWGGAALTMLAAGLLGQHGLAPSWRLPFSLDAFGTPFLPFSHTSYTARGALAGIVLTMAASFLTRRQIALVFLGLFALATHNGQGVLAVALYALASVLVALATDGKSRQQSTKTAMALIALLFVNQTIQILLGQGLPVQIPSGDILAAASESRTAFPAALACLAAGIGFRFRRRQPPELGALLCAIFGFQAAIGMFDTMTAGGGFFQTAAMRYEGMTFSVLWGSLGIALATTAWRFRHPHRSPTGTAALACGTALLACSMLFVGANIGTEAASKLPRRVKWRVHHIAKELCPLPKPYDIVSTIPTDSLQPRPEVHFHLQVYRALQCGN